MRMNLSEAVHTWAIRRRDSLAISGSQKMTYGELDNFASICAQKIMDVVPDPPKRIAILADDNVQFIISLLGIIRSGNIFVLINPTLSNSQINRSLNAIQCEYYISSKAISNLDTHYIALNNYQNSPQVSSRIIFPNTGVLEEAGIIFSSGTTGEPKALMRNSFSILSEAIQWIIELQLQIGVSFLIPRPLYYTGGFILMYSSLFSGGRVDLLDDLSCKNLLDYMQKTTVDWAFIVPSVIREMLTYADCKHMAKNVLTMGSFIYHSEKMAFYEMFRCNLIEAWGNSEGLGTITEPSDLFKHPGSIGRPFFSDYLGIVEPVNSNTSTHMEGVLFGISDNEFSEYIGRPELTKDTLYNGFIYSEDIGYQDSDGYFYLTGRVKDIIVIDGIKVFPADIEREILDSGKVTDCAVFSISDANGNDVVSAAVVTKNNESVAQVIAEINLHLASHEKIRYYIALDVIPRNHGGKVDRNAILQQSNDLHEAKT